MRYLRSWLALSAGALLALAALNAWVDPFGAWRAADAPLGAYKPRGSRIAKAELLRAGGCDHALLGTSRVDVGIDPTHPALPGEHACNLGLPGSNMWETARVLDAVQQRPEVRYVTLFADFLMFSARRQWGYDFSESRFNPDLGELAYRVSTLIGWHTTRSSLAVLAARVAGEPTGYTDRGHRRNARRFDRRQARELFTRALHSVLENPETYGAYAYSPERVEWLRERLERLAARGVQTVVVIPPVHVLQLEAIRAAGLWPVYETWKRDLLRATEGVGAPLWDFSAYTGPAAEPLPTEGGAERPGARMAWFWEASHFKRELGDRVLARVYTGADPDLLRGVRLTGDNLESELSRLRADRDLHLAARPDTSAFFAQVIAGLPGR